MDKHLPKLWIAAACSVVLGASSAYATLVPGHDPVTIAQTSTEWTDGYQHFILSPTSVAFDSSATPGVPAPAANGEAGAQQSAAFAGLAVHWDGVVDATPMSGGLISVRTTTGREALELHPEVASVQNNVLLEMASVATGAPNDPLFTKQWVHNNTGASSQAGGYSGAAGADSNTPAAWPTSTGTGIVIANIDSGVDIDHVDLAGNIWTNVDEVCGNSVDDDHNGYVDDCHGWDIGGNDNNPRPDSTTTVGQHGTHIAGILGAIGDNSLGVVGMAPNALVMPIKISAGETLSVASAYTAVRYAVDNGADIINASWGTSLGTSRADAAIVEQAIDYAHQHGVLVVAAAGNDGVNIDNKTTWPASFSKYYDNVLTVSASTNSDTRASFSNFGAATVGVYAPGHFIQSTLIGGDYGSLSGTSMAAPVVSAGAALLLAADPSLTPAELAARLKNTADTRTPLNSTAQSGRLNLEAAMVTPELRVAYSDFDTVEPDTAFNGTANVRIGAASAGAAASIKATVLTPEEGAVFGVSGLPISAAAGGTPQTVTTNDNGEAVVLSALTANHLADAQSAGFDLQLGISLPAGDYALALQLSDSSNQSLGNASLVYFTVGDHSAAPTTTTTASINTTTTAPRVTTTTAAPRATTTTVRPATSTTIRPTTTTATPTTARPATTTTTRPATTTTARSITTTTARVTTSTTARPSTTTTTRPVTTTTARTATPTTVRAVTSTTARVTTTTAPRASTTTTARPVTTTTARPAPTTTTTIADPVPTPVTSNGWTIASVAPRNGLTTGGETVTINGTFLAPSSAYVNIGGNNATVITASSSALVVIAPSHAVGLVGVTVSAGSDSLTLPNAYRYVAAPATTTTTRPVTTTTARAGTPTTARPVTTTTASPPVVKSRGSLRLIKLTGSSPLAQLSASGWPGKACSFASCTGNSV